jgi:DNA-binding CsgD family transcriptional regulator
MSVPARDLRSVLDVVHRMNEADDGAFLSTMLDAVRTAVDADSASYNELNPRSGTELRYAIQPRYAEHRSPDAAYRGHLAQHPVFAAMSGGRLARGHSVAVSDLVSAQTFRRLALYTEYYRHREVEDQLITLVDTQPVRRGLLVLNRSRRGFGARDRATVELLAPHVRHAVRHRGRLARLSRAVAVHHHRSRAHVPWTALTRRELDVVETLATGATDQQIGRLLGISTRTVGKHLETVYRKLNLAGRAAVLAAIAAGPAAPVPFVGAAPAWTADPVR